ncbi:MAG: DinB family protein [Candidatus Zixiibacteriota bacterium]|nr:MAG: DinB family protein [candidate division Zixibacteria bacterium]
MITTIDQFKESWRKESDSTRKMLAELTDESIKKELVSDHRTLGRIAWHIAQTIPEMLGKTGLKPEGPKEDEPVPDTAEKIRNAYDVAAGSLLNQVGEHWSDETLQVEDDLYGEKWKRGMTLRILIDHEIHHRGQMTVLMRLAGLKVPGLYGPSKEEWSQYGMKEPEI